LIRPAAAFIAALFLLSGMFPAVAAANDRQRLESVRKQRAQLEEDLQRRESDRAATADALRETERAISAVGRKLRGLGEESRAARAELAGREQALRQLERRTSADQARLARLLGARFRAGDESALAVFLGARDPNVAARERYFHARLAQAQAELIGQLREDVAARRRLADEVRERGVALAEIVQREEGERAALRERQQERQAVLAKMARDIDRQKRTINTLRQDERRLTQVLDSIAKRAAARPKVPPPRPAARSGPAPSPPVSAPGPTGARGEFARLRGKLIRPAQGTVAGRFGARRDDAQATWKGLFIRASEGAEVRAVAAGEVVYADWLRGYGNLLIIDHADDFLSVYGNNQTLLADVGQKVAAGTTVATVGASGGQSESGLYFELRHRGQAFDPGSWLGPR